MTIDAYAQFAAVQAPIATSATLPPACYHDPDLARLERDAVFSSSWIGIGRHDQWKSPGEYSALNIAGIPLIVLRDRTGQLRVFSNTCRHRGSELLEGTGKVKTISCPFHCWTYTLDGRLMGAPHMPKDGSFDKSRYGLFEFRAAEREGFAFICLNGETEGIDAWLGDFAALHAPWSLPDLVLTRRVELEAECNWKAFLEVFNEYYHLPFVHPDSIDSIYAPPDGHDTVTGRYASQFGATEGSGGLLESAQEHILPPIPGLTGRAARGTRYTWLFPNMTFAASTEAVWVYEATPLEANRCRVVQSVCFPKSTVAQEDFERRADVYYQRMDAALAEDLPALERQQRGQESPFAVAGRYCLDLEPNVAHFGQWYAQRMKGALEQGQTATGSFRKAAAL